jgi:flagellar protein FliO/FliZ
MAMNCGLRIADCGLRGWLIWAASLSVPFLAIPVRAAEEQARNSVTTPVLDLAQTSSLALTMIKVFGALLLTVGIMLLIAVWLRKLGLSRAGLRQGKLINILDTKMIAPKKYVAVVRIAEKTLALGITDQQITLLSPLEGCDFPGMAKGKEERQQTTFSALLGRAIKGDGR